MAITLLPTTGALEAEYKGVQSGQFDFARIPPTLIPQAKAEFEPKGGFLTHSPTASTTCWSTS